MRENTVKSIWKRGGAAVNGWMGIPSGVAAEGMAQAGWDSLTADLQHGLIDYQTAVSLFQAVATTPTIPLARVPWNEPGVIMKLLDAGAFGIICPMINPRAECEAFVGACRYAPTYQFTTILSDNALLVNAAKAAVGAMREGNVTGAQSTGKSAGGSMY